MSSISSDNESYDSDGSSSIHNESSIDGGSGDPFLTEDDDVIRLEELNLVPLNRPDKTRLLVQREADHIFIQEEWNVNNWETLGT